MMFLAFRSPFNILRVSVTRYCNIYFVWIISKNQKQKSFCCPNKIGVSVLKCGIDLDNFFFFLIRNKIYNVYACNEFGKSYKSNDICDDDLLVVFRCFLSPVQIGLVLPVMRNSIKVIK